MRQGLNYLRVSSRRQVDKGFDEDGLSLPAQREACLRYNEAVELCRSGGCVNVFAGLAGAGWT
jgi:hypothetical protein